MFHLTFVVLWLIGCRVASAVQPVVSTPGPETATPAVVLSTVQPVDKASPTDTAQSVPPLATTTQIHVTKQPIADIRLEETGQLDDNTLALRTALAIHFGVAPEEIQFNISEQTQDHTKGGVAGGYFLAAREEGTWIIVYDGQATPGCDQIDSYDFPPTMVPECLDTNNNLVRRAAAEDEPVSDDAKAIRLELIEKTGIESDKLEFVVAQNTGIHAKGTLKHKDDAGGGYFIAAKVDGQWVIVYDGQATPSCAEIAPFEFPVNMVPECLDGTNNLVVRAIDGTAPAKEAEASITIVGTVMNVSLSARIIMLQEPVQGFSVVALTEETELFSPDGDEITLQNIGPGVRIEASGVPGDSAALLAGRVRLLP